MSRVLKSLAMIIVAAVLRAFTVLFALHLLLGVSMSFPALLGVALLLDVIVPGRFEADYALVRRVFGDTSGDEP